LYALEGLVTAGGFLLGIDVPFVIFEIGSFSAHPLLVFPLTLLMGAVCLALGFGLWALGFGFWIVESVNEVYFFGRKRRKNYEP
jgi:hypothetical protein